MREGKILGIIRRLIFYPLAVISLACQTLPLLAHMVRWWDYGPSVVAVIDAHIAASLFNLVTGCVLLGLGWRTWLGWTLAYQVVLSLLSATAAIDHADIWLASDKEHLTAWELHPQWVGYAFCGLSVLCGLLLIVITVTRKSQAKATSDPA